MTKRFFLGLFLLLVGCDARPTQPTDEDHARAVCGLMKGMLVVSECSMNESFSTMIVRVDHTDRALAQELCTDVQQKVAGLFQRTWTLNIHPLYSDNILATCKTA
jgi:hypothetical protein